VKANLRKRGRVGLHVFDSFILYGVKGLLSCPLYYNPSVFLPPEPTCPYRPTIARCPKPCGVKYLMALQVTFLTPVYFSAKSRVGRKEIIEDGELLLAMIKIGSSFEVEHICDREGGSAGAPAQRWQAWRGG